MKEDFLHYIWQHKKFDTSNLKTVNGEVITIVSVGQHNLNSGPDFFNSQLKIDTQLWAGNVEIHVKSSDWYLHNHETDKAYDNVVLHVVWEHDTDVFRKDNTTISTLELKQFVSKSALNNYAKLFSKTQKWINCENDFESVDAFIMQNWLERLYFERLERKAIDIDVLLNVSTNDWETVLFKMLAKNFGLKVNGDAFLSLANSFDFSTFKKLQSRLLSLEALLFGQSNLLEGDIQDAYYMQLQKEYIYLKQKFIIDNSGVIPSQFFRLRPPNFPTIRLSQLAKMYNHHSNIFAKIIKTNSIKEFYKLLSIEATVYWKTHYTFGKVSKLSKKRVTKSFIDLLIMNTIIPLKFSFAKFQGKEIDNEIMNLIQSINSEKNSIVDKFNKVKQVSTSALESQALIQLKSNYCDKNKCLQCEIGNLLLNRN